MATSSVPTMERSSFQAHGLHCGLLFLLREAKSPLHQGIIRAEHLQNLYSDFINESLMQNLILALEVSAFPSVCFCASQVLPRLNPGPQLCSHSFDDSLLYPEELPNPPNRFYSDSGFGSHMRTPALDSPSG